MPVEILIESGFSPTNVNSRISDILNILFRIAAFLCLVSFTHFKTWRKKLYALLKDHKHTAVAHFLGRRKYRILGHSLLCSVYLIKIGVMSMSSWWIGWTDFHV